MSDTAISTASDDTTYVKNYLSGLLQPHKKNIRRALIIAVLSIMMFVVQSYVIAHVVADWLVAVSGDHSLSFDIAQAYLPWLAVLLMTRPLLNFYKNHILLNVSIDIRQSVRNKLLTAVVNLGETRHHFGSDGSLSTKILEQVDELDGFISRFYVQKYLAVLTPLVIVLATFYHSVLAGVLMLLTAPLVPIFMILVGSAAADKSREQMQAMSQLSGRFLDLLRGMPTLQRLQATKQASHAIATASQQYQERTMNVLKLAFLSGAVLELFSSLAIALVALYLGLGLLEILPWAKGSVPVPYEGALFILLLAPEFYAPLRQLGSDYHAKANAEAGVTEFYPILQASHLSQQATQQATQQCSQQSVSTTQSNTIHNHAVLPIAPSMSFFDVSIISHDKRVRLASTTFNVLAQQKIAITGVSGIGKSSLLQAILGFVPFTGTIEINGQILTQADLVTQQQNVGYLAQSSTLLPMSIADNLRLAKKHATDEELQQVLEQVDLWSLIHRLPQAMATELGERGKGLSGGQQQRLSLAQLLLRNNTLWLLDEPCAHLDPETAEQIFALLGELGKDKTMLLVSHDVTAIDWLDSVIELKDELKGEVKNDLTDTNIKSRAPQKKVTTDGEQA